MGKSLYLACNFAVNLNNIVLKGKVLLKNHLTIKKKNFHPRLQTPLAQSIPNCLYVLSQFPQLTQPTIIWFSTCDCIKLTLTKFTNDPSENRLKRSSVTCESLLALGFSGPSCSRFSFFVSALYQC